MNLMSWAVLGLILLSLNISFLICWKLKLFDGRWFK